MGKDEPDNKADAQTDEDRDEALSLMDPLLVAPELRFTGMINDLTVELAAKAAGFRWSFPKGRLTGRALTTDGIKEIHQHFGELLPEELLWAEDPESGERICIKPGTLRERYVKIEHHIPVSPAALPRFLQRFAQVYSRLSKSQTIAMATAAHHRLL